MNPPQAYLIIREPGAERPRRVDVPRFPFVVGNTPRADITIRAEGRVRVRVARYSDGFRAHNLIDAAPGGPTRTLTLTHGSRIMTGGATIQFFVRPADPPPPRASAAVKSIEPADLPTVPVTLERPPVAEPVTPDVEPAPRTPVPSERPSGRTATRPPNAPAGRASGAPASASPSPVPAPDPKSEDRRDRRPPSDDPWSRPRGGIGEPRVFRCRAPRLLAGARRRIRPQVGRPHGDDAPRSRPVHGRSEAPPPAGGVFVRRKTGAAPVDAVKLASDALSRSTDRVDLVLGRVRELLARLDGLRRRVDSFPRLPSRASRPGLERGSVRVNAPSS